MTEITSSAAFDTFQGKAPLIVLWGQKSDVNSNTIAASLDSFAPGIQALSKFPGLSFLRIDVDATPDLAMKYSVRAVPTMMLFMNSTVFISETTLASFLAGIKLWIV